MVRSRASFCAENEHLRAALPIAPMQDFKRLAYHTCYVRGGRKELGFKVWLCSWQSLTVLYTASYTYYYY